MSDAHAYSAEDRRLLAPYVTTLDAPIYCFRNLPEEVTAVLFAYVSRSAASFRDNLLKLVKEGDLAALGAATGDTDGSTALFAHAEQKAKEFHEKWVIGYGHASVAEHADIKYAVEDVSILASKVIEDNRLGRYTEKSTRYQVFERDRFYTPPELTGAARETYDETIDRLFSAYLAFYERLLPVLADRFPQPEGTKAGPWKRSLHAKACDIVRYLLPAATKTSIGLSMNARTASHAITKLMSHPLPEMNAIGSAMRTEGRKVCPSLLKYADDSTFFRSARQAVAGQTEGFGAFEGASGPAAEPLFDAGSVRLWHYDHDGEDRVLAALAYPHLAGEGRSYADALSWVRDMPQQARDELARASMAGRGNFDWPLRAFETASMTFELVCDYGAWRDIQRHRMSTQIEQPTGFSEGYDVPEGLELIGAVDHFHELMDMAKQAGGRLSGAFPQFAPYLVPLAYRKRVLMQMNLRELWHFINLRSGDGGHISYRRVAWAAHDMVSFAYPALAPLFPVDRRELGLERLASEQRTEAKREKAEAARAGQA